MLCHENSTQIIYTRHTPNPQTDSEFHVQTGHL